MTHKGRGDGALVDERDKSVERSEGSTSLSRFILGANALKVGAVSALVPIFVSFSSAVTGSSGPLLLAFLVSLLVLIPFGFLSAFAFGVATFVYEAFYLILPGREQRDQRWLASWRRQQGDAIEVLDTAGGSLFQFALVSKAGMSSVLHLPQRAGGETPRDVIAVLYVKPKRNGYRIQLQVKLPPQFWQRIAPCFTVIDTVSYQWAPDLEPKSEGVDVPVRGFADLVMRPLVSVEEMVAFGDDALWVLLHRLELAVWAEHRAYWRVDAECIVIEMQAKPKRLDKALEELRGHFASLRSLLLRTDQPIQQLIAALLFRGLDDKRFARLGEVSGLSRFSTRAQPQLPWWVVIFEHFDEWRGVEKQLFHFFLHASEADLRKLYHMLRPRTREVFISCLSTFVAGGWLTAVQSGLPVFDGVGGRVTHKYPVEHLSSTACFDVWFDVLTDYLCEREMPLHAPLTSGEEALVSLFVGLVEKPLPTRNIAEFGLVMDVRKAALQRWLDCDLSGAGGQVDRWLQELDLPFRCELINLISLLSGLEGPGTLYPVEEGLLPSLFVEKPQLAPHEREVCLAALKLTERIGSGPSSTAIRQGLATWDANVETRVIPQATHTLGVLTGETLQGAMSTVKEEEEGQLSFSGETEGEGQLSLVGEVEGEVHDQYDPFPLARQILARLGGELPGGALSLGAGDELGVEGQLSLSGEEAAEGQLLLSDVEGEKAGGTG